MFNKVIITFFIFIAALSINTAIEASLSDSIIQNMVLSNTLSKGMTKIIIPFKAQGISSGNVNIARSIIRDHLRNVLRKDMAGTYNVNVKISDKGKNLHDKFLIIAFSSDDSKRVALLEAAFKTLYKLSLEGISQKEADTYKTLHQQRLKKEIQKNDYWVKVLSLGDKQNLSLKKLSLLKKKYNAVNAESLKKTFKQINPFLNYRIIASS